METIRVVTPTISQASSSSNSNLTDVSATRSIHRVPTIDTSKRSSRRASSPGALEYIDLESGSPTATGANPTNQARNINNRRRRACFVLSAALLLVGIAIFAFSGTFSRNDAAAIEKKEEARAHVAFSSVVVAGTQGSSAAVLSVGSGDSNLEAIMSQYGSAIGSDGSLFGLQSSGAAEGCPAGGHCQNFFTWNNLQTAIAQYNTVHSGSAQFLSDTSVEDKGRTLAAFLANIEAETLGYTACKERVRLEDGTCPAQPNTGGCSGGKIGDYTSATAASRGWTITTCNGLVAPTNGCVDFWGNPVSDPTDCWFGRGALQISWPGNYDLVASSVKSASGSDICAKPDLLCESGSVAFLAAIGYWKANEAPWKSAHTIQSSFNVVRPADTSANPKRIAAYNAALAGLGIKSGPTGPAKPTTRCGKRGQWADANGRCGTPCPNGQDSECPSGEQCYANLSTTPC